MLLSKKGSPVKSNITLIGMPGAGKSTIGIILAKCLSFGFIDTDVLIQTNRGQSLQQILDESDHFNLRRIEADEIMKISCENHVIATGGSAVYSDTVMAHLRHISTVIFLKVGFTELERRIHNYATRGIAKEKHQTFAELYDERQVLYNRYAESTIDCNNLDQEQIVEIISNQFNNQRGSGSRTRQSDLNRTET